MTSTQLWKSNGWIVGRSGYYPTCGKFSCGFLPVVDSSNRCLQKSCDCSTRTMSPVALRLWTRFLLGRVPKTPGRHLEGPSQKRSEWCPWHLCSFVAPFQTPSAYPRFSTSPPTISQRSNDHVDQCFTRTFQSLRIRGPPSSPYVRHETILLCRLCSFGVELAENDSPKGDIVVL
jgi:hypothetical protein